MEEEKIIKLETEILEIKEENTILRTFLKKEKTQTNLLCAEKRFTHAKWTFISIFSLCLIYNIMWSLSLAINNWNLPSNLIYFIPIQLLLIGFECFIITILFRTISKLMYFRENIKDLKKVLLSYGFFEIKI